MDTTAETFVGATDNDELFLGVGVLGDFGLGFVEDLVGGLAVGAGFGHGALGAGQLGRGHDLHCLGDLFDVADGFEAALDLAEGGIGGGVGDGRDGGSVRGVSRGVRVVAQVYCSGV